MKNSHAIMVPLQIAVLMTAAVPGAPAAATADEEEARVQGEEVLYAPAENRHIRVAVEQVVQSNSKEYLPKDKHWLQLRIVIANKGADTIAFSGLRERMPDGTVHDAALSSADLKKPPNMTGMAGKQMGIGTAAAAAGWILAPPLALIGSAAGLFGGTLGLDKSAKRQRKIDATILKPTPIAPGTSVAAWAYVPALRDHNGLIVFYSAGEKLESLALERMASPAALPPVAQTGRPEEPPAPASTARKPQ